MQSDLNHVPADLLTQLQTLFPAAFAEGEINTALLQTLLQERYVAKDERYELSWPGKAAAYNSIHSPAEQTLLPHEAASINWHTARHMFVAGENLEVLKNLQETHTGKVKMIYIDPPYNTGSDSFIYADRFAERKADYLQKISKAAAAGHLHKEAWGRNDRKENGHFHSNWLSMMLPRLFLARNLLTEDGIIFISIDDNEMANLRLLMNEIFGEENFVASLMWRRRKTQANLSRFISPVHDYILCFAKNVAQLKFNKLPYSEAFIRKTFANPDNDPRGIYQTRPLAQPDNSTNAAYELQLPNGRKITAKWSCSPDTFQRYVRENRLYIPRAGEGMPRLKIFLSDLDGLLPNTWLDDVATNEEGSKEIEELFGSNAFFSAPKPTKLLRHLIQMGAGKDDIILDFFAGSGSTAHAVMDQNAADGGNRRFICVQMPEPIAHTGKAFKAGYATIADICCRRIQMVMERHLTAQTLPAGTGLRVYRLQSSNPV